MDDAVTKKIANAVINELCNHCRAYCANEQNKWIIAIANIEWNEDFYRHVEKDQISCKMHNKEGREAGFNTIDKLPSNSQGKEPGSHNDGNNANQDLSLLHRLMVGYEHIKVFITGPTDFSEGEYK